MTLETMKPADFVAVVDTEKGTVDRRIFSDADIYQLELEQIFARCWNFMAHESQVPNAGDFFLNYIGEDRVIVVRDKEGGVQVLLNTCRHRGNAVCRAEEGRATSFMCTYHGWTYDLKGNLVGVPGFKDYYHEDLKREEWGLVAAPKVESYKGFVFASLDPEAVPLEEFLGDIGKLSINQLAERGDIKVFGGVQKYTIECNWKLAADNVWDFYHPAISHASSFMVGRWRRDLHAETPGATAAPVQSTSGAGRHIVMLGEYGHALSGPKLTPEVNRNVGHDDTWRQTERAKEVLGPVGLQVSNHPHIFPNMWFATNQGQISMRLPKGPTTTEIWWFTLIDKDLPQEKIDAQRQNAIHVFGPAGMLEQEDGENWGQSTIGTRGTISKRYPLNYAMDHGHAQVLDVEGSPPYSETNTNEHAQLWHYRSWAEWMAAESWADLKANHSPVPSGYI